MTYTKSIYIFHRSLRLNDNISLIEALKKSDYVIPVFIFTPEQITSKNKFKSLFCIKFMLDALIDLNKQLKNIGSKLYMYYGEQHIILKRLLKQDHDIEAVFINKDYTPYALEREDKLKITSENENRNFYSYEDYLLHDMNTIRTGTDNYYSVFTPFYKTALKKSVSKPKKNKHKNYISKKYANINEISFDKIYKICIPRKDIKDNKDNKDIDISIADFPANHIEAQRRMKNIIHHKDYDGDRDNLSLETTRLSPYIKFGLLSVREIYHKVLTLFDINHSLIKQLYWREFYYNLSFNRQDILSDSKSFRESYDKIKWYSNKNTDRLFELWKTGNTGYPVIDAGMRELNNTGFMHNRARLITSNFLVKHLFIDWRKGEEYFASKLIDYDPSVNNGNWQFTSGSGADSQPYFRMMNPWLQAERHDINCEYIKKWVPELITLSAEDIHNWHNTHKIHRSHGIDYPAPCKIYNFAKLKNESKKIYSKAFTKTKTKTK